MRRALAPLILVAATATLAAGQDAAPVAPTTPAAPSTSEKPADSPPSPTVLATRQTTFTIPFTVEPRGSAVAEVQLFSSRNLGASWELHTRQRPEAGRFVFRAPADGEYWFASRTIDLAGKSHPAKPLSAEVRVRVDTAAPQVQLTARPGPAGGVVAVLSAADGDLVQESVRLEFQPVGQQTWQPVVLDPTKIKSEPGKLSGEVSWFPQTRERKIGLRLVARDGAGNSAVINRGVFMPSAAQQKPPPLVQGKPPASPEPSGAHPFERRDSTISHKPAQPWSTSIPPLPVGEGRGEGLSANNALPPATTPIPKDPPSAAASPPDPAPTSEPSRFTPRKRFKLDYDADDVPVDDIAAVELWGTNDSGKTWLKWGADPDKQSPVDVEVTADGVFGFRVVIAHRTGIASHTPQAGDAADMWIGVDGVQPTAKLGNIAYGKGASAGKLEIQWQASDTSLSDRPVTLLYATEAEGPWTTLASGLANTGQFLWQVEPTVPRRIYLKLEVRDQAGNLAEDKTADVVQLEGLAPRGRIRGLAE